VIIDVIVQAPERLGVSEPPLPETPGDGVLTIRGGPFREDGPQKINIAVACGRDQLERLRDDLTRFLVHHPGPS
jgi:hypothetical protein